MSTPNGSGASGRKPQAAPTGARTSQQRPGQQRPAGQAGAQRPASGQRPAGAQTKAGARPSGKPARGVQPGLVRPAPKAKVRKARLLVSKVDVWSVLKLAFLLSVALGVITVVVGVLLWTVFDVSGVFNRINELVANVLPNQQSPFDVKDYVSMGQVTSLAVIVAVVNVVLLSALAMVTAFIYNLAASMVGGVSLTLTDD
ncbi:MAG: DUF3566 domain-containing protein [Galactobacter sp.]